MLKYEMPTHAHLDQLLLVRKKSYWKIKVAHKGEVSDKLTEQKVDSRR